jgi:acetylornithine deacetylase/succinyl-diaminopimelate desuccinylase-like protein
MKELAGVNDEWRIYARSASDDKAPIMAILAAMDALQSGGIAIKNRIKFILDGEEEAGSPSLPGFCRKYQKLLAADILFMCDGPAYFSGDPTLFFGVRGITTLDITVYGPITSLHSGHFGNWAPNPAMRLAKLLNSMKDQSNRVVVKGFYDTVVPLSTMEREVLAKIPPYDNYLKKLYGFAQSEAGKLSLMEAIQLPSLNVRGMNSGWVGRQARTIVPDRAQASIDIRLVKGCDPKDMVDKVIAHIRSQGFHVVGQDPDMKTRATYPMLAKVVSERGYRASRTSMDIPVARRVVKAFSGAFDQKTMILPTLGGSLPIYIFEDTLKIPIIGVSIVNHDNNQHQPDENLRLGNLWRGIETFTALLMMESR